MSRFQIRIPYETMERVGWIAQKRGCGNAETIRHLLHVATRDASAPERAYARTVNATDREWAAWRDAAESLGMPLDELIRSALNGVTRKVFAPAGR